MKSFLAATLIVLIVTISTAASAYVGPGAGLSLLGALWALLFAVGTALLFVLAWPVRRMLRRRRASQARGDEGAAPGSPQESKGA